MDGVDPTSLGVWPRVEVAERPETDRKGRLKTKRDWYLILENTTGAPVYNVDFTLRASATMNFSA